MSHTPAVSSEPAPAPLDELRTTLWLRVAAAEEAALAARSGLDGVEAPLSAARSVRTVYRGPLRLRCESLPPDGAALDADELSLPADALPALPATGKGAGNRLVARLSPEQATPERVAALRGRADAVSIEVTPGRRLFAALGIAELDGCARACRAAGLRFGIGGDIEAPDVARLLLLAPDHLGFDRAARVGHRAGAPLDPQALAVLRELVPHAAPPHAAIDTAAAPAALDVPDRLFVRDFVLPLSVGAYHVERDARQRVRFTVEAQLAPYAARPAAAPRDMRDVVSYDIILETIRMLAGRPHVAFVETLAEEIAATLLRQPRLVAVVVSVEKLDVAEGSVGIRIERRRLP